MSRPTLGCNVIVGPKEEGYLERLLRCITPIGFDKIIVCLTSEDTSVRAVAEAYATHVVYHKWNDSFADARNACLDATDTDWVLFFDADDVLHPLDASGLIQALPSIMCGKFDFAAIPYHVQFAPDGRPIGSLPRACIWKRRPDVRWKYDCHEMLTLPKDGKFIRIEGIGIWHMPGNKPENGGDRNLRILSNMYTDPNKCDARIRYYYGKELYSAQHWEAAIGVLTEFVSGREGLPEEMADACWRIAMYYAYDIEGGQQRMKQDSALIAETFVRVGLSFFPKFAELWVLLGDIEHLKGDVPRARECWKKALTCPLDGILVQNKAYYRYIPADRLSINFFHSAEYASALYFNDVAGRDGRDERLDSNRKLIVAELTRLYGG